MPDHSYALVGLLNNRLFGIYIDQILVLYLQLYQFIFRFTIFKRKNQEFGRRFQCRQHNCPNFVYRFICSRTGLLIAITQGFYTLLVMLLQLLKQRLIK